MGIIYLGEDLMADSEEDVKDLPTTFKPGTVCTVITTGNLYILNSEHKWKQFGGGEE